MFLNNYHYIIGITTSISWASSTCVVFILLMHLVNGAKYLNITFLLAPLFGWPWAALISTVIGP